MDREQLLRDINQILNRPDISDALLRIYISRAVEDIKGYCNRDDLPEGVESSVVELVLYHVSRQGIEGTVSYSAGGLSYSYGEGMPKNIRERLQRFVKGRVIAL